MKDDLFKGSAEITDEGIKKHFKNYEPINAVFELIWNGLDARASRVDVTLNYNQLKAIESITVLDNGDGISYELLRDTFGKFNESLKKNDEDKHGSQGKGRLAFHVLGEAATWFTRCNNVDSKITILGSSVKDFEAKKIESKDQSPLLIEKISGTCVEIHQLNDASLLGESALHTAISEEFGWYLALNKSKHIYINGKHVEVPSHDMHETRFKVDDAEFQVKVIRWDKKPSSEKSYNYFISSENRIIDKELSKFNNKITFYASTYIFSKWVDELDRTALAMDPKTMESVQLRTKLNKKLKEYQQEIYKNFLRRFVDIEIKKYEVAGYFPEYRGIDKNYAEWRRENTKSVIKNIYLADPTIFHSLNVKQAKILIRLIDKILVSNENDSLLEVLENVIDLDDDSLHVLADQLTKTTLENIIGTIEILQKRNQAINKLREIMNNKYKDVLETPDLQQIIESNTWLFGPQYTIIGAEEDGFQKIAKELRDSIKNINVIGDSDVDDGTKIDGVNRQVDLFLARKIPYYDSTNTKIYKCIIIEIKRPGISLNKKHLQQIDDYAEIISKHHAFNSEHMKFEIILVGRKISKDDYQIKQRLEALKDKGESGLVSSDGKIKCYVKNWFTIFDEFTLTNDYLLNTLNLKLEDFSKDSKDELVRDLQTTTH